MKLEFLIASRYLKSKKRNSFISSMTIISIFMVVLFVAAPILTSSVTNGFQRNIIDKVYTFDFHVRVRHKQTGFLNWKKIKNRIESMKNVKSVHTYFEEKALMKRFGQNFLTHLKGMKKQAVNRNIFGRNFRKISGELKLKNDYDVILAETLAANLFVRPGDTITVAVVDPSSGASPFNTVNLKVKGVFTAGYAKYDTFLAYTSLKAMRKLTNSHAKLITTLGIYLKNAQNAKNFIKKIKNFSALRDFNVINSGNADIFQEFNKEKKLISVILYVALLLSFLNIYITLNVIVVEKQKDIGIMKAYGIKSGTISRVFIFEGVLIGFIGAIIGVLLGLFLTVNIDKISHFIEFIVNLLNKSWAFAFNMPTPKAFEIMPVEKFYLSTLPYKIIFLDVFLQSSGAMLAAIFAAYFPSRRAAKKRPVEVLRYE